MRSNDYKPKRVAPLKHSVTCHGWSVSPNQAYRKAGWFRGTFHGNRKRLRPCFAFCFRKVSVEDRYVFTRARSVKSFHPWQTRVRAPWSARSIHVTRSSKFIDAIQGIRWRWKLPDEGFSDRSFRGRALGDEKGEEKGLVFMFLLLWWVLIGRIWTVCGVTRCSEVEGDFRGWNLGASGIISGVL